MLRTMLAGCLALSLPLVPPAMAQHEQVDGPAAEIDRGVIGLPIHTSDGREKGILIGEIERPLGLGPVVIVITTEMFVNRGDRIELTLTAEHVRDRLARSESER